MPHPKDKPPVFVDYGRYKMKNISDAKRQLRKIFEKTAVEIRLIGSGGIRGLKTRPKADLLVSMKNIDDIHALYPELQKNGYLILSKDEKTVRLSKKNKKTGHTDFDIYVVSHKSPEYIQYISLHHYLIVNAFKRAEYQRFKFAQTSQTDYAVKKKEYLDKLNKEAYYYYFLGKHIQLSDIEMIEAGDKKIFQGTTTRMKNPDGLWKKVYIVGKNKLSGSFSGRVIAFIAPENDYTKAILVAAPENRILYEPQILDSLEELIPAGYTLTCLYEKSCGAIVYTMKNKKPHYILIQNRSHNIGFPKGHIWKNETEKDTARREIREETNLSVRFHPDFREAYDYTIGFFIKKFAVYYLAETDSDKDIQIPGDEILSFSVVPFEEAKKMLTYPNERRILKKAHEWITNEECKNHNENRKGRRPYKGSRRGA